MKNIKSCKVSVYAKEIISLVKLIRASSSQQELANLLKLPINTINKWENGQQKIKWNNFIALCELQNINLAEFLGLTLIHNSGTFEPLKLVKHLIGDKSLMVISTECDISYNTVYNWDAKGVSPNLEHVLALIDVYSLNKGSFLLEALRSELDSESKDESILSIELLIYNSPKVLLLLALLETPQYTPLEKVHFKELAKLLSVPLYQLDEMIEAIVKSGRLVKFENRYSLKIIYTNLSTDLIKYGHLVKYWFKDSLRIFLDRVSGKGKTAEASFISFGIYNFDDESLVKVKELSMEFSLQLRKLSTDSNNAKNPRLITLVSHDPLSDHNN
ncbi:hypothetical protein A9Q84_16585 [Halobacteriovorax marinus]|uniref:HTH cro/C1-type domain-containing protein n=1 Tax=Halobacteriovorax marinus TaxID=97084 RepID=A0A1Y5F9V6_9BACT|nr:hypothetical protein A9Q84_16585 [Halobacteriovorax marinus]